MKAGTSVLKRVTSTAFLSPGGSYLALLRSCPSIESPFEVISLTLPSFSWLTKNGWYGTCSRCCGPLVANDQIRLTTSRPIRNAVKRRLRGIIGGFWSSGRDPAAGARSVGGFGAGSGTGIGCLE